MRQRPARRLLHLLREEQIEIAEIPIARIADQFLQAIHEWDSTRRPTT
jgi:chromatin segregation and condensation protein Rec8/ScpA/Scc1 (kleisin family)